MQAKDVMTPWVATIDPDSTIRDAAKMMLERRVSALPVVDGKDRLVGIISEGDLVRRPELGTDQARSWWLRLLGMTGENAADFAKTHATRVRHAMTSPVVSVTEGTPLGKIALLLEGRRIKRVPVLRAGQLVGIVSRADLVRQLAVAPPARRPASGDDRSLRRRMLNQVRESGVDASYLNISASGGVLHLWGGVRSDAEKRALRVAAQRVPGVRRLEDHTFVMPPRLIGALGAQ